MPVTPAHDPRATQRTATTAVAINPFRRVKILSSGAVRLATAGEFGDGVCNEGVDLTQAGNGLPVGFDSLNAPGTFCMVASGAITAGAAIFAAADGKVASSGTIFIGFAETAAAADLDYIRVRVPASGGLVTIAHTVTAEEAALNSNNGRVDLDTGFGVAPSFYQVTVLNASDGIQNTSYAISALGSTDAGKIRIDGINAGIQLDAGDIVFLTARP